MSQTPVVRPASKVNSIINVIVLLMFVGVGWLLGKERGLFVGTIAYLGSSMLLRGMICRHHRAGIRFCKKKEFKEALPEFQKSLEFFDRYPWVDKYRAVTLLSAAGMNYREMALVCRGFCYAQIGNGEQARLSYAECLRRFPANGMAEAALRMMDSAAENGNEPDGEAGG
ncbi:MAG: hypothetical protein GY880_22715 [Planctomycetaceae bacterium]|nr:hypothetical protein [Planctomycetaceae bacterium]